MITAVAALMLMTSDAPPEYNPFSAEVVSADVAAKRASRCGLGRVTSRYDKDMDEDILSLRRRKSATDAQLACLDQAAGMNFVDVGPALQERFIQIRTDRLEALMQADANKWLADHGLLDRVPKYVAGSTNEELFQDQVETLCGPHAKGTFKTKFGPHPAGPSSANSPNPSPEDLEAFLCIMRVTLVAGYKMGFVGNEAYQEPSR